LFGPDLGVLEDVRDDTSGIEDRNGAREFKDEGEDRPGKDGFCSTSETMSSTEYGLCALSTTKGSVGAAAISNVSILAGRALYACKCCSWVLLAVLIPEFLGR
jgi:hypothetical protein